MNIAPAKQAVFRDFFEGPCSTYRPAKGEVVDGRAQVVAWASRVPSSLEAEPGQVAFVEDGFIRSLGLGSSFYPASSLVLDRSGIYYDPSRVSDLERMLNESAFDAAVLAKARRLRSAVVERGLSKYNLRLPVTLDLSAAAGRKVILVPGQVEDDASVRTGGGGISNLQLLERVRAAEPEAFILYKEHPDVVAGNRRGRISAEAVAALADLSVGAVDMLACINQADEIHTLTSLAGFEALLRNVPVTTYGMPFYAGWALTHDNLPPPRPRRPLEIDELVAGALLVYPLYLDPVTRLPCDALQFVERLAALQGRTRGTGMTRPPLGPLLRFARAAGALRLRGSRSY